MKSRTFVDTVTVHVAAGGGGNGCSSFRREKFVPRGGPDGGDGGNGGSVIFQADLHTDSLIRLFYQPEQRAERGEHGRGKQQHGHNGHDLVIAVPCGTGIFSRDGSQQIGELLHHGDRIVITRGGKGGMGNCHFKTSTHQAPTEHTAGEPGEELDLRLDLKTIADFGLVGFPNAGKSSMLAALTDARPKIAAYPFTTLNPILGTMVRDEWTRLRLVDVPGLIRDAHKGIGLGHDFLRHIERATLLIFVVDMAGTDGRSPVDDYRNLKREIKLYSDDIAKRPAIVVANKMDVPAATGELKAFKRKTRTKPFPVSAVTGDGIDALKKHLFAFCAKHSVVPSSPK